MQNNHTLYNKETNVTGNDVFFVSLQTEKKDRQSVSHIYKKFFSSIQN